MWTKSSFGKLKNGQCASLFTFKTTDGLTISLTDYGISLVSIVFPAKGGEVSARDVLLGFDSVQGYEDHDFYSGCIVGRVASRIASGKFCIDKTDYQLSLNSNGGTHLHGGFIGMSKVLWDSKISDNSIEFNHTQLDKTDGYPGSMNVTVTVSYQEKFKKDKLTARYLSIDMTATCDKPTPINLTFHPYFNMDGHDSGTALNNKLTVFDYAGYLPMDPATILPTGDILSCRDTPFNFDITRIGDNITKVEGGYDHTYSICYKTGYIVPAAEITSSDQEYKIRVLTDQPGIHVYSGNFLNGAKGKSGAVYDKHSGIALEAQNFPNAINVPKFPNSVLRPGEIYKRNITLSLIF